MNLQKSLPSEKYNAVGLKEPVKGASPLAGFFSFGRDAYRSFNNGGVR